MTIWAKRLIHIFMHYINIFCMLKCSNTSKLSFSESRYIYKTRLVLVSRGPWDGPRSKFPSSCAWTPTQLRSWTIQNLITAMSWIVSEILYHKSVQTYDKSIDMLKWKQVGLRVPGAGSVPLRERQAQSRKFQFFQEKWESRWGCGDRTFHLISDLVRRSSCYIMYPLGNHLN